MEVRTTAEMVKSILEVNKPARDDDYILYGHILNEYGLSYSTPFSTIAAMVKRKSIPSFETVSRCRRKAQEIYPELQGKAAIARDGLQLEYVEFARDRSI